MYVKTNYVPPRNSHMFTCGKLYKIINYTPHSTAHLILNDGGDECLVLTEYGCAYLGDDKNWIEVTKIETPLCHFNLLVVGKDEN